MAGSDAAWMIINSNWTVDVLDASVVPPPSLSPRSPLALVSLSSDLPPPPRHVRAAPSAFQGWRRRRSSMR